MFSAATSATFQIGATTAYNNIVQFPSSFNFSTLSNLSVTVAITDASDTNLGLTLEAPSGDTIVLFVPQTQGGVANTGRGISGTNVGVLSSNDYPLGTTFDDAASRDIFDPTATGTNANAAPFIGNFQTEGNRFGAGNSLVSFVEQEIAKGINGTWKLETVETSTSAPSTPSFINYWTLNFTGGRGRGSQGAERELDDVTLPGTNGLVVPGSPTSTYTTTSAAFPWELARESSWLRTTRWAV